MKRLLIIFVIVSCNNDKTESKKEQVAVQTFIENDSVRTVKANDKFDSLYNELLEFKSHQEFKNFGFSENGPYVNWLNEVRKLSKSLDSKLLLKKGLLVAELEVLGFEYHKTGGKENHATTTFNNTFSVKPETITEIEKFTIEKLSYDKIKRDYNLFGKWTITNTFAKKSYLYEIYYKGEEYLGIIPSWNYKKEILLKKGENYFVKGNKWGEYYRINKNMKMTLYDRDGELKTTGYVAVKID